MSRTIVMQAGVPQEFYEVSNFFRILESSGPLSVEFYFQGREVAEALDVTEGYAEKFEIGQFDRVRLVSPTNQTVQFVQRWGNSVQYDKAPVGDSNIVGSVPLALDAATIAALMAAHALDAATINALKRPPNVVSWSDGTAATAVTPVQVFSAAANVNGAILWGAYGNDAFAATASQTFIAKATAPANAFDGQIIVQSSLQVSAAGTFALSFHMPLAQRIPPGLGLWFISSINGSPAMGRCCRYELL